MSRDEFSTKQDCLISDRAFWFGLAIYALLFIAVAGAFAGNSAGNDANVNQNTNWTGTLIFGARNRLETDDTYRVDLFHHQYGAVTFHRHWANDFSPSLNWSVSSISPFNALVNKITELPAASASVSGGSPSTFLGASGAEIAPMQIALGVQSTFIGEDVTANPEPTTWIAAALAAGAISWSQRRRFVRSFLGRRKRIAFFMTGAVFVGVVSASANLLEVLPEMGDLARWTLFAMGNNGLQLSGFAAVQGDVGAAGSGIISIGGHATIDGDLYYRSNSILVMGDDATITGTRYHNRDSELDNGLSEASRASDHAFALAPTRSYTNINLVRNQNITVQGAPGETVVLSLKNFVMQGSATFTLQGTATTNFIINVTRQFSLSGYAKIVLSGSVQWDNVLFNVRGQGTDVLLSSNARLEGILMANLRTVRLSGQSRVIGEVIAKRIVMSNGSQITHPPVVSPEQPPTP
jgi:cytoskeletal protein CcmA (bactofilin family)